MNLAEILKLNKQNVRNIIKKITKTENEDLEQEVYLRVVKNSNQYNEQGKFKSWISMIARNVSFDYLKSAKNKNELLTAEDSVFHNIQDKKETAENKIISLERQKRILNEVNNLKQKLKEIIILTEFEGLTYEECAKKLKCPIGTVKSRVYTAKKELAEKLQDLF